eukprot:scaffold5313_cov41-Attheya_sp.AAC.3
MSKRGGSAFHNGRSSPSSGWDSLASASGSGSGAMRRAPLGDVRNQVRKGQEHSSDAAAISSSKPALSSRPRGSTPLQLQPSDRDGTAAAARRTSSSSRHHDSSAHATNADWFAKDTPNNAHDVERDDDHDEPLFKTTFNEKAEFETDESDAVNKAIHDLREKRQQAESHRIKRERRLRSVREEKNAASKSNDDVQWSSAEFPSFPSQDAKKGTSRHGSATRSKSTKKSRDLDISRDSSTTTELAGNKVKTERDYRAEAYEATVRAMSAEARILQMAKDLEELKFFHEIESSESTDSSKPELDSTTGSNDSRYGVTNRSMLKSADAKIAALQSEIDELKSHNQNLRSEKSSLQAAVEMADIMAKDQTVSDDQIQCLQEEISHIHEMHKVDLAKFRRERDDAMGHLTNQITEEMENELLEVRSQLENNEQEYDNERMSWKMKEQIMTEKLKKSAESLSSKEKLVSVLDKKLQESSTDLEAKYQEKEKEVQALHEALDEAEENHAKQWSEAETLDETQKEAIAELEAKVASHHRRMTLAKNSFSAKGQEVKKLEDELEAMKEFANEPSEEWVAKVQDLESDLLYAEEQYRELELDVKKNEDSKRDLERSFVYLEEKLEEATSQLANQVQFLSEKEEEIKSLGTKLSAADSVVSELDSRHSQELQEKEEMIRQHQTKLEVAEMELQTRDSELEALKSMSDSTITELLNELSDAQLELEGTGAKMEIEVSRRLALQSEEHARAMEKLQQAVDEAKEELSSKCARHETAVSEMQCELEKMISKCSDLEFRLSEKNVTIQEMERTVVETQEAAELKFQTEASSLCENIQYLENALAEKEKELNENISKAEALENLLDARESETDLKEAAQVSDLKTSVEDLERQLKEKDEKVDELCEQLGKMESATSVLKRSNKLHEDQYSEYMISQTCMDKKLEEIEKSLDQKMKLNDDLQAQVMKFESEANEMMEKISSQSALDANLQEKISSLEATVEMYEMVAEKSDEDTDQK